MGLKIKNRQHYVVKNKYGKLDVFYEPEPILVRYGELTYEREYVDMIESDKYDLFVDVGASWGYFSRIAAKHCKQVVAIEAHPIRYGFLSWNTKDLFNVENSYSYITDMTEHNLSLISDNIIRSCKAKGKEQEEYKIYMYSLDDLLFNELDYLELWNFKNILVKMDIEGSELKTLKGSIDLCEDKRFTWMIDYHPVFGVEFEDVAKFFPNRNIEKIDGSNKIIVT